MLDSFIRHIDPTDENGSFYDRGYQYSPAIFYHSQKQKDEATAFIKKIDESNIFKKPLKVKIIEYKSFYPAEDYHQDYYKKSAIKYKYYRYRSGRDAYIESIFGKENTKTLQELTLKQKTVKNKYTKPSYSEIRKALTKLQYDVTQKEKTERPFDNEYWDNKKVGIYVDIVSGEPLFSSRDKYRSGTGWPSFSKPLNDNYVIRKVDKSLWGERIEIKSKIADSHLGHVFNDGPASTGLRYCMNSASLRFIPVEQMDEQGYGEYKDSL